jgi:4-hydroxy-2-oxoglutarate aldolase
MLLHGIFPPITTPFYPDGRVYFKKLEHNVERYSKTPVAGIVVLGSTGEAITLSDDERREVLKMSREVCAPHTVLIAGTGAESALETLRLTEYAARLGYDAALVRTPFFYKPQLKPANILAFYRTVADHSPVPILIYSVPVFTGYDMPPELVIELSNHPNIVGIKESGGDAEKIRRMVEGTRHIKRSVTVTAVFSAVTPRMINAAQSESSRESNELVTIGVVSGAGTDNQVGKADHVGRAALGRQAEQSSANSVSPTALKTREKQVGFQVLAGTAQRLLPALEAGAVGAVLAFATPAPTACYEIYTAWKEGDAKLAREKQERVSASATRVGSELGIPALKYALDLNGYYGGPPRLPLLPITADLKAEVETLMSDIRN